MGHRSKDRSAGRFAEAKWKNGLSAAEQASCLELTRPESALLGD